MQICEKNHTGKTKKGQFEWSVGVMEYWGGGDDESDHPSLQYSITPSYISLSNTRT